MSTLAPFFGRRLSPRAKQGQDKIDVSRWGKHRSTIHPTRFSTSFRRGEMKGHWQSILVLRPSHRHGTLTTILSSIYDGAVFAAALHPPPSARPGQHARFRIVTGREVQKSPIRTEAELSHGVLPVVCDTPPLCAFSSYTPLCVHPLPQNFKNEQTPKRRPLEPLATARCTCTSPRCRHTCAVVVGDGRASGKRVVRTRHRLLIMASYIHTYIHVYCVHCSPEPRTYAHPRADRLFICPD